MNEPEPSAVANGSPPQASPFPFGPAAVPTPTTMPAIHSAVCGGTPFSAGARTIPAGGGQRDTLQNANFTHQHRCNPSGRMQRDENPLRRGASRWRCEVRFAARPVSPSPANREKRRNRIRTGYKKPRISFVGRRGGRFGRRNVLRPVGTLRRRSLRILFEQIGRRQRLAHQKGFGELRAHTFEQHDRLL